MHDTSCTVGASELLEGTLSSSQTCHQNIPSPTYPVCVPTKVLISAAPSLCVCATVLVLSLHRNDNLPQPQHADIICLCWSRKVISFSLEVKTRIFTFRRPWKCFDYWPRSAKNNVHSCTECYVHRIDLWRDARPQVPDPFRDACDSLAMHRNPLWPPLITVAAFLPMCQLAPAKQAWLSYHPCTC